MVYLNRNANWRLWEIQRWPIEPPAFAFTRLQVAGEKVGDACDRERREWEGFGFGDRRTAAVERPLELRRGRLWFLFVLSRPIGTPGIIKKKNVPICRVKKSCFVTGQPNFVEPDHCSRVWDWWVAWPSIRSALVNTKFYVWVLHNGILL